MTLALLLSVAAAFALPPDLSPIPDWASPRALVEASPEEPAAPEAPAPDPAAAILALKATDKALKQTRAGFRAAGWTALGVTPVVGVKTLVARSRAGEPLLTEEEAEDALQRAANLKTGFQVSASAAATSFATAWVLKKARKRVNKKIAELESAG